MSERNPSTTSFTDFRESKGLDNHKGQNNCWLNATIQLLWHQDGFRESLHRLKSRGHYKCRREQCVYCQIQRLLKKYIYENNQSIPPDELREALTQVNQSFVAGEMGDPIEAYETVLKVLHVHLTGEDNSKSPCEKEHCLVHQKFHHNIVEERTCDKCYDTQYQIESELSKWVSARDVINLPNYTPFMKLFKNSGPGNDCSRNNCIGKYNLIKRLENAAESFVISVGWDSQRTPLNDITIFINKVPCRMKIDDLYDQITDDSSIDSELLLNGIVCYYGMHYTAYIFHTKMKKWVYLDDNNVNVISSSWINVMNHMTKNYQQPCMLLYSKLDKFKKLNLENALRKEETTYDNDFSPQKIAVADDFTNRAMKEKEDQELKDAAFAKQLMEEEEKRLKEFEMQQKLEAERKHQEAIERQRRQLEIERQEAEKLRLKQEEERIKKIREQEIELKRYEQEKKRKDEAERQRLAEEERKRRLVEEENKRRLAEVERREKEKKEVEEIMRRAKQKEEDDKRRQEAEDRDRKEKLKKAEWERLEYQRRLGVAGSYSGSQNRWIIII
ncbi:Oidioi.mRNA.OKI2018_I69.XSR.g16199.t1.cds [Oikopleura dioica]|uniref:Oidioi.mRNA.OKI2018_I69.XSR.g16199.t1.cds n=1 Tax=Oikopleura dioica TaxID=34765 RepID=A0ABN7SFA8_OIKDI|nr:Oidioi.mRNA.OKI2018_I69.XSR.g16199.t1.cds [Oikopleura dioica]